MTVLEAIQKSAAFLGKKGVESARLNAELLLAHVLRLPRMKLYLNFDRALTAPETDALRELVRRRGLREPLQHITGTTSFCGHEITVSRAALVPRPETELLAELGWQFLNELQTLDSQLKTALDFGTGTGCIAIAIATKCPAVKITALDISAEALALAQQNAVQNQVAERIEFLHGDGFAALGGPRTFALIFSNPPYIASAEIATLEPEVRNFDPRAALDGGADGLDFYRRLAAEAKNFLAADGKVMVEFGDGQADEIKKIFESEKWIVEAVQEDYSHRARILVARL